MKLTVTELAEKLGAKLLGDDEQCKEAVSSVAAVGSAGRSDITFVKDDKYGPQAAASNAAAIIVNKPIKDCSKPQLVVDNVDQALIDSLTLFAPKLSPPAAGIDPTAIISQDAKIAKGVSIGPWVVIDEKVSIGENTIIMGGCKIGQNTIIEQNCRLDCNVVIYHNCRLGSNVVVQANTTIGSTGFGYAHINGKPQLIPHNGGVIIEDFVEIGANCCIDRAKFGNTIIGAGTKIDNLVQVAHNVIIGKCCMISGQVGIAGSSELGDGVILGGQVGMADNTKIGAGTLVAAQAGVVGTIEPGQRIGWTPAMDMNEVARLIVHQRNLPKMAAQLKRLTKKVENLEAAKDNKG